MNRFLALVLASSGLVLAQSQPSSGGWRRVGDRPQEPPPATTEPSPQQDPEPVDRSDAYGQPQASPSRPAYGLPAELMLKPGTYLTIRLGQPLSSDRNLPGDTFVASLAQPVVVDGVVIANRNQMVYGRVAEAERAHSDRPSRLGLELTSITLADGAQAPVRSQLVGRRGGTTPTGEQVGTVAATTGVGAVVGAAAGYGTGAAIGAGVGAIAGIAGVILTRNHPTILYPETALTFAIQEPLTISTVRAPQAFRFVGPEDYEQAPVNAELHRRPSAPAPYSYAAYPYPYYASYPYWYPYYGVSVVIGPRYGWGRFGYRRW